MSTRIGGTPILTFAFVGPLGFAQFFLGMRDNRTINLLIFISIFGAFYVVGYGVGDNLPSSWISIAIVLGISLFLILLAFFLLRYLSKERIVRTLS